MTPSNRLQRLGSLLVSTDMKFLAFRILMRLKTRKESKQIERMNNSVCLNKLSSESNI